MSSKENPPNGTLVRCIKSYTRDCIREVGDLFTVVNEWNQFYEGFVFRLKRVKDNLLTGMFSLDEKNPMRDFFYEHFEIIGGPQDEEML